MQTIFLDTISSEEYDPLLLTRGREKLKVRLYLHHGVHTHCTHIHVRQHYPTPTLPTHIAHRSLQAALMTPSSLRQWTTPMRRG